MRFTDLPPTLDAFLAQVDATVTDKDILAELLPGIRAAAEHYGPPLAVKTCTGWVCALWRFPDRTGVRVEVDAAGNLATARLDSLAQTIAGSAVVKIARPN